MKKLQVHVEESEHSQSDQVVPEEVDTVEENSDVVKNDANVDSNEADNTIEMENPMMYIDPDNPLIDIDFQVMHIE